MFRTMPNSFRRRTEWLNSSQAFSMEKTSVGVDCEHRFDRRDKVVSISYLTMCQVVYAAAKLQLEQQRPQLAPRLLHCHHGHHELFALAQAVEPDVRGLPTVAARTHVVPQGLALRRRGHVLDDALGLIRRHGCFVTGA